MEVSLAPEGCAHCQELRKRLRVTQQRARKAEAKVRRLTMQLDAANARLQEVTGEAKATSLNSSLPPSMNPPGTKHPSKRDPDAPKRKIGAQIGHKGKGRKLLPVSQTHRQMPYAPTACPHCGGKKLIIEGVAARHQVMELPDIPIEITEHQAIACRCEECGKACRGEVPSSVLASVCGERLSAFMALLSARMHASRRNVALIVCQALGAPVSLGTVVAREKEMSQALWGVYEQIKQTVASAAVKYVDETGWKGKASWMWVAAAADAVVFSCSHARTYRALSDLLGGKIAGVICTDRYGVYDKWPQSQRGICWAHLKRDFQRCVDRGDESGRIGKLALEILKGVFEKWRWYRKGKISQVMLGRLLRPLRRRLKALLREGASLGLGKTSGLCKRLLKLWGAMWRFTRVRGLEPTNNLAERMLRGAVIWRKISFGSQSRAGLEFVQRMLSVAMTLSLRCSRPGALLEYLASALKAHRAGLPPPPLPTA